MRIIVISDSHGHKAAIDKILRREASSDVIIFLGDVTRDIEGLIQEYSDKKFYVVSGNCDFLPSYPYSTVANLNGIKIFITHGHTLGVKSGIGGLVQAAQQQECQIALYGHTHMPDVKYVDGIHVINPGSCARSRDGGNSYAAIDIRENGILPTIIRI